MIMNGPNCDIRNIVLTRCTPKENRIYIRGEFRESLGMNFFSPFQSVQIM